MTRDVTDNDLTIRPAQEADYEDVVAFTQDTWGEDSDYIPDVFHDWLDDQGDERMTYVADTGEDIAGLAQAVMLSDTEAWSQGMRVNPEYRNHGVGRAIVDSLFEWSHEQGAVVSRNMVFSWNQAGLGQSRGVGFDPVTEFRWLHPDPEPGTHDETVTDDVDAAWSFWTNCEARSHLRGLALDMDESWALRELTPELLERAREETALFAVTDGDGTRAMGFRTRTHERENDDGEMETWAEYGVGAWADIDAAETLLSSIAAKSTVLNR